jgi:pyrroline-5-carboxylate reductase
MASAIIGGLLKTGTPAAHIHVVEPFEAQADKLRAQGLSVSAAPNAALQTAQTVVWAVKPQSFVDAASAAAEHTTNALHVSVMAGITSASMARLLNTERIVRSMPNTPALVGLGMTGLYARAAVSEADKATVNALLRATGELLWLDAEAQLDAVTALSGSGPAYVFYFLEHLVQGAVAQGLSEAQAKTLALQTFKGATHLAAESTEALSTLRERVTSKGGTTHAALEHMRSAGVGAALEGAVQAASVRAKELGAQFG